MNTPQFDPRILEDLRRSGYVIIPRQRVETLNVQSALNETDIDYVRDKDTLKGIVQAQMIRELAAYIMNNRACVQITEIEPDAASAWPLTRKFRATMTLIKPAIFS